ncbi:MAG: xanthine dehydrogenase accessory protein XdhC [Rhizobiales bacterium]|nr:xanthine dehydrogenase accessory protein XdhC [Hyphomicrobiales bacterium]
MRDLLGHLESFLAKDGVAVLITIVSVQGSSPREAGAQMVVRADGRFAGTIGGGALEWQALGEAQKFLHREDAAFLEKTIVLGPDLGQCCGGRVQLRYERLLASDRRRLPSLVQQSNRMPVLMFGAGHVGRALVLTLAPLPFDVRWVDPRRSEFPSVFPDNVTPVSPSDPLEEVNRAAPETAVLIFTHSHALDLALCGAALKRDDLASVGVIGSKTKRARFVSQLQKGGLSADQITRLTCPIGLPDLGSKEPAAIAAGIAVQLLRERAQRSASSLFDKGERNAG